jgi:hypothetical protein
LVAQALIFFNDNYLCIHDQCIKRKLKFTIALLLQLSYFLVPRQDSNPMLWIPFYDVELIQNINKCIKLIVIATGKIFLATLLELTALGSLKEHFVKT